MARLVPPLVISSTRCATWSSTTAAQPLSVVSTGSGFTRELPSTTVGWVSTLRPLSQSPLLIAPSPGRQLESRPASAQTSRQLRPTVSSWRTFLNNVPVAIQSSSGATILAGGTTTIAAWGQGHEYTPNGPNTFQGAITPNSRPASLLSGSKYYTRSKPQYETLPLSSFKSVRSAGATGEYCYSLFVKG